MSNTDNDYFKGYVTLREACEMLPGKPHILSLQRWASRGRRGKFLRTAEVGGRLYTRPEWLREFIESPYRTVSKYAANRDG